MNKSKKNIWIFNSKIDVLLLGLPVWMTWVILFLLPNSIIGSTLPLWVWVIVVLLIDVGHVWSTLFRTYFDKEEFKNHKDLLTYTPILCFSILFCSALISTDFFWRLMAYMALHHFVKQQIGFWAIYNAKLGKKHLNKIFKDKWILYFSMFYPIIFWHFEYNRSFSWFIEGDFFDLSYLINYQSILSIFEILNIIYWVIIISWLFQEIIIYLKAKEVFPFGKVIWVITTAINWYLGIIYFNSDIAFTLTNVVAHGIPYYTLVFIYIKRKKLLKSKKTIYKNRYIKLIFIMILVVMFLAITEEYFWDMLLNRNKSQFFENILTYPLNQLSNIWLQSLALAALSVPQVTHYIVDGFIWKSNNHNPYLKQILSST